MKTGPITVFVGLIFFFSCVNGCLTTLVNPYVYKFGNNYGTVVQVIEGTILPFVYQTYRDIKIPDGMSVTYVEVQVHSLSPAKVDYDNNEQQVSIGFSITQLSMSSYKIIVKAVPTSDVIVSKEYLTIH